jgi:hypothetical protein
MKIKFGTTSNNLSRAALIGQILGIGFSCCALQIQYVLDNAHESHLHSSMSNVTAIQMGLFCGISYDDCRCSVQSTKDEHLKNCLTDSFLLGARIFPLVSFILQICLIRDLFTFIGSHTRFVINSLGIIAVFIFVIIADGIYRSSCFHRYINGLLCATGGVLFILSFFDLLSYRDKGRSSHDDHNAFHRRSTFNDHTSEEINNESVFWRDLL